MIKQFFVTKVWFIIRLAFMFNHRTITGLQCWECRNAFGLRECLAKGRIQTCLPNQNMCQLQSRNEGWAVRIEKSCKSDTGCGANYMQNLRPSWSPSGAKTQCNERAPSSVCTCCCNTYLCNYEKEKCQKSDAVNTCTELAAPKHGSMKCSDRFSLLSTCIFRCDRNYILDGDSIVRCDYFGKWNKKAPSCNPIVCTTLQQPRFGKITCTNGEFAIGTVCRFSCNNGYQLSKDIKSLTCVECNLEGVPVYGVWSRLPATCRQTSFLKTSQRKPEGKCKPIGELIHGSVRCTKGNFIGSRCVFKCNRNKGYEVHPSRSIKTTCQRNKKWNIPKPCCTRVCPQFAEMDLLFLLDSSRFVSLENWKKMIDFAINIVKNFIIRDDASHFGIIRYNSIVDTENQVLLEDNTDKRDNIVKVFRKLAYDGRGPRMTGMALNYTANILQTEGNRPHAKDVVLLITNGVSKDNILLPIKKLRDIGATVLVLPMLTKRTPRVIRTLFNLVENFGKDNLFIDDSLLGFEVLNENFSRQIVKRLCSVMEKCSV